MNWLIILFYEYFGGENGRGLGASHQTGRSGLVANMSRSCMNRRTLLGAASE